MSNAETMSFLDIVDHSARPRRPTMPHRVRSFRAYMLTESHRASGGSVALATFEPERADTGTGHQDGQDHREDHHGSHLFPAADCLGQCRHPLAALDRSAAHGPVKPAGAAAA